REVMDLTQLLALAVDPDDDLALLSVLRSPLGPVSDEGLVLLAAIAGGLYGEQAAANVDKLVGFAREHELHGGNARSFVAQVRRLADDDAGEADAGVVEESDPHAVRLLTVHAAKGLEFPVVVVPECAAQP